MSEDGEVFMVLAEVCGLLWRAEAWARLRVGQSVSHETRDRFRVVYVSNKVRLERDGSVDTSVVTPWRLEVREDTAVCPTRRWWHSAETYATRDEAILAACAWLEES